jgi:hypothetical protein
MSFFSPSKIVTRTATGMVSVFKALVFHGFQGDGIQDILDLLCRDLQYEKVAVRNAVLFTNLMWNGQIEPGFQGIQPLIEVPFCPLAERHDSLIFTYFNWIVGVMQETRAWIKNRRVLKTGSDAMYSAWLDVQQPYNVYVGRILAQVVTMTFCIAIFCIVIIFWAAGTPLATSGSLLAISGGFFVVFAIFHYHAEQSKKTLVELEEKAKKDDFEERSHVND